MRIREAEVVVQQPPPPARQRPTLLAPPAPVAALPQTGTTQYVVRPPQPPLTDDEVVAQVPAPHPYDAPVSYRREVVIREYYEQLPDGRQVPIVSPHMSARVAAHDAAIAHDVPRRRRRRAAPLPERRSSLLVNLLWIIAGVLVLLFLLPPPIVIVGYVHGFLQERVTNSLLGDMVHGTALPHAPAAPDPAPTESAVPQRLAPIGVLQGASSITGPQADEILASYDSPAQGTGQTWVDLGAKYNIDPAYAIAFFVHESSAGTDPAWAGWKNTKHTESTHNVGNIICAGYATCYGRFRDYPSWEVAIEDWYRLIRTEYLDGRHHETVADIIRVYAPASDNNDEQAYIAGVNALVEKWRAAYASTTPAAAPLLIEARVTSTATGSKVTGTITNTTTAPITLSLAAVILTTKTGEGYGLESEGTITLAPQQPQPLDLGVPITDAAGLKLTITLPTGETVTSDVDH